VTCQEYSRQRGRRYESYFKPLRITRECDELQIDLRSNKLEYSLALSSHPYHTIYSISRLSGTPSPPQNIIHSFRDPFRIRSNPLSSQSTRDSRSPHSQPYHDSSPYSLPFPAFRDVPSSRGRSSFRSFWLKRTRSCWIEQNSPSDETMIGCEGSERCVRECRGYAEVRRRVSEGEGGESVVEERGGEGRDRWKR